MNRVTLVIAASTLAIIALVFFQVRWLRQSQALMEEQFNNRVKMALCSAIERIDPSKKSELQLAQQDLSKTPLIATPYNQTALDSALKQTLAFYNINLPYRILPAQKAATCGSNYCCALNPVSDQDGFIQLDFPQKQQYLQAKMSFMFLSSVLIVLFVSGVFLFANYTLIRQKQLNEIHVDFFNNMAHELLTPLTNIKLAVKLLIKKQKTLVNNNYVHIIQKEGQKLIQQVERVLHLAKLENGQYQLKKETFNLVELMEQVVDEMRLKIDDAHATIRIQATTTDWQVVGDKFHLGNAFRNLIDNALKYSTNRPQLTISFKKQSGGVFILFEDNGIGISKTHQSLIFKKFQRIRTGNRHDQKGFGLGLAYVKMIMERHQGFVKIFSELNKGSRFDLFLPCGVTE